MKINIKNTRKYHRKSHKNHTKTHKNLQNKTHTNKLKFLLKPRKNQEKHKKEI